MSEFQKYFYQFTSLKICRLHEHEQWQEKSVVVGFFVQENATTKQILK